MKKLLGFFVLLLLSCNDKEEVIEYYKSGRYKAIYIIENGSIEDSSVHFFDDPNNRVKSVKYWKNNHPYYQKDFFENGSLKRNGRLLKDNFRIGKWSLYTKSGKKSEVIEYLNIDGKPYLNQNWKLNVDGDTIPGGGFFEYRNKDTAVYGSPIRFHFFLKQRIFINSELYLCIAKKGCELDSTFSNQYNIPLDTINNMAIEFAWHAKFKNRKYDVLFDFMPRKTGRDTLRGFLLEKLRVENNDSIDFMTRKFYFNIPYHIKPATNSG